MAIADDIRFKSPLEALEILYNEFRARVYNGNWIRNFFERGPDDLGHGKYDPDLYDIQWEFPRFKPMNLRSFPKWIVGFDGYYTTLPNGKKDIFSAYSDKLYYPRFDYLAQCFCKSDFRQLWAANHELNTNTYFTGHFYSYSDFGSLYTYENGLQFRDDAEKFGERINAIRKWRYAWGNHITCYVNGVPSTVYDYDVVSVPKNSYVSCYFESDFPCTILCKDSLTNTYIGWDFHYNSETGKYISNELSTLFKSSVRTYSLRLYAIVCDLSSYIISHGGTVRED